MTKNLSFASQAMRLIAAASLACAVATVGCSTDRTPGAGQPERYAPSVGPTMPTATPGSEQGSPVNPPMTSSYTAPNSVLPQHVNVDAIAIAAANQGFRGRYLGIADPGGAPSYAMNPQAAPVVTGQFINPSDTANPEITVNRSISSDPTEVISGGGGGGVFVGTTGGVAVSAPVATTGATTSAVTLTPTTAATTLTPTTAANRVATTTTATTAAAAPVFSNRTVVLTPTVTSGVTPSPTAAANRLAPVTTGTTVATTGTTTTRTSNVRTTSALTNAGSASGSLVIGRSANGTVTVTNITTVGDRLVATTPSAPMTTAPITLQTTQH
jgi:hypothetical protein